MLNDFSWGGWGPYQSVAVVFTRSAVVVLLLCVIYPKQKWCKTSVVMCSINKKWVSLVSRSLVGFHLESFDYVGKFGSLLGNKASLWWVGVKPQYYPVIFPYWSKCTGDIFGIKGLIWFEVKVYFVEVFGYKCEVFNSWWNHVSSFVKF